MKDEGGRMKEAEAPENLRSRLKRYALEVLDFVDQLPDRRRFWNLANQLSRSATSVGANYREANRARSDAEFIAKIGDCLKELDESEWWLELIEASLNEKPALLASLLDETNQLLAILTAISKKARSHQR